MAPGAADLLAATTRGGQLCSSQRLSGDRGTRAARPMFGPGVRWIHGKGGKAMINTDMSDITLVS